mmetsp:Transcript_37359/g.112776  ORF Transcript_37359/g.112776 Transcript_37359/m.112776 type:complete len:119 (-) Transcript_37359:280-636(-)
MQCFKLYAVHRAAAGPARLRGPRRAAAAGPRPLPQRPGAAEAAANATLTADPAARPQNCASAAYAFCCEIGTPCDCTKGTTAAGQCKPESYGYCCGVGTPCDCSQPPLAGAGAPALVV